MRRARRQRQIGRETPGRERQQWGGGGGEREREAEEKGEAEGKTPIEAEIEGGDGRPEQRWGLQSRNKHRKTERGEQAPAASGSPERGSLQGLSASLGDSRYLLFPKTVFHPLC